MIIVRDIEVSRFRSLREASLSDLKDFSVLAGLNNSGKSNFLRALHLFFTNRPEPGMPFDLTRDFYRGEKSAKKKKRITIALHFSLPSTFRFRKGLEAAGALLGTDFKIRKSWTADHPEPEIYLEEAEVRLGLEDALKVNQFLGLISFRYIPNRVIPTEVIRQEQQALRDVLVRRLAKYRKESKTVFQGSQSTPEALVQTLSNDINRFAPDIAKVRLATASSLADLAFNFGYRLTEGNAQMEETEQGSGLQSVLMFETLHLIDRDYFQRFGWKQAAIWAVEEPESSLNTALEVRTAHLLSGIAGNPSNRLQVIGTTHSDLMMQYCGRGYYVEKQNPSGKPPESVAEAKGLRELLEVASRFGVSRWVNPILFYPLDAVALLEGRFDRDFLIECVKTLDISNKARFVCLEDLKQDPTRGGVETLFNFVRDNVDVIKSRHAYAKVCVLLDWDSASRISSFRNLFRANDPFICIAWNRAEANPNLSESFHGIERFFSDRLIAAVESLRPELFFTNPSNINKLSDQPTTMTSSTLKQHLEAIKSPGSVNPAWKGVADTTHAFAQFLAVLAAEAEQSQRKIIRLTWVLFLATIALILIAAVQTAEMFFR